MLLPKILLKELKKLRQKTGIAIFGSILHKPISQVHDIDLIIVNPNQIREPLKLIAKKYNLPLDIFIPPLADRVGKIIIYPNGIVKRTDEFIGEGFFDDAIDVLDIKI